jgi:hypothetical protein
LITTWRQAGSSIGSSVMCSRPAFCHGGSWWTMARRPERAATAGRRQVERDRQDVLGDHHVGTVDGGDELVLVGRLGAVEGGGPHEVVGVACRRWW